MIDLPKTNDIELEQLLRDVDIGRIQLPDFQRSWTWDDDRIRGIIASLTQGYPMGAIMMLQYGNESVRFKYRTIEGVKKQGAVPDELVLDGQQRLTSMYRAIYADSAVDTVNEKKAKIRRYYYLDIRKCLDENEDRLEAVVSVPEDRKIKANFDRDVLMDLSEPDKEYENEMFPLNIIFNSNRREDWVDNYKDYFHNDQEHRERFKRFRTEVLEVIEGYRLPVIQLNKSTPREAVCKVFENVNTGGVSLTVFELVTASFAADEFDLRKDWEDCRDKICGNDETLHTDLMDGVSESDFLTAITLYTTFLSPSMTSCKRKDVLDLSLESYQANRDHVLEGFKMARDFLFRQKIFRQRDLPYSTQLIPLAAICAAIGQNTYHQPRTFDILSKWYWCGVLGEMYGSANETHFANDMEDVVRAIRGEERNIRTINAAFFSSTRLLSLQTRNSAAYKGIMALLCRDGLWDFMQDSKMDAYRIMDEAPDIHHIFPQKYCEDCKFKKEKWNSIVNKTPLLPASNRQIGGDAPSIYSQKIMKAANINEAQLRQRVESHLVDFDAFMQDDFDAYFIDRAKKLLAVIEKVMGKTVADKGAEQTIQSFGASLA